MLLIAEITSWVVPLNSSKSHLAENAFISAELRDGNEERLCSCFIYTLGSTQPSIQSALPKYLILIGCIRKKAEP